MSWGICIGLCYKFPTDSNSEQWGAGVVISLERDADLHMAQLMPLPLTVSCFSKIQIGFTFLVPAHPGSPRKGPLNGCVCESNSERILKISQYLVKLWARVRCLVFFDSRCRSTQPCIPAGSLNRVPASAGVRAGMSPLPGGR